MNPDLDYFDKSLRKPEKGSGLLARHADDAARKKRELEVAAEVKKRDGRCRWPEAHKCLGGPLEAAHIVDKSLRGENDASNIVTLCPWIHRRGPESIHGKELRIEKETDLGANGILSFWRQLGEFDALGQPVYYLVARERAIGILERD